MAKIIETPLIRQYHEMKEKHPDAVLLFRVGDFYECFSEDAKIASDILGITLTRRAIGSTQLMEITGFPHHALDTYLPRLIRAGKRVAICEQLEDPRRNKKLFKGRSADSLTSSIQSHQNTEISDYSIVISFIISFFELVNILFIFSEICVKTRDLRRLSIRLGISPKRAFEECSTLISQPKSLFD